MYYNNKYVLDMFKVFFEDGGVNKTVINTKFARKNSHSKEEDLRGLLEGH